MENHNIDRIVSMLLDKWYVRCDFDWIAKEDFLYIENNIDDIISNYKDIFSDDNSAHKEIELERYTTTIFLDNENSESMEYDYRKNMYIPKIRKTEKYDLLINLKRKNVQQVLAMYWID